MKLIKNLSMVGKIALSLPHHSIHYTQRIGSVENFGGDGGQKIDSVRRSARVLARS